MAEDLSRRIAARRQQPAARRGEGLLFLAAIGIVGVVVAGGVFAAGLTLLPPPSAPRGPAAPNAVQALPRPAVARFAPAAARLPIGAATPVPAARVSGSSASRPAMTATSAAMAETPPAAERKTIAAPQAAAVTPAPSAKRPSATAAIALGEGDGRFRDGEFPAARFYYERAFDAGDAEAAVRLGETFDPAFLTQDGLRRVRGDTAAARFWYRRAAELGSAAARERLSHLDTEPAGASIREAAEPRPTPSAAAPHYRQGTGPTGPTFHELLERILHPPP